MTERANNKFLSFAIADAFDGKASCDLAFMLAKWFAAGGKRVLVITRSGNVETQAPRKMSEVMEHIHYLRGRALVSYLATSTSHIGALSLDVASLSVLMLGPFADDYDMILFAFGKDIGEFDFGDVMKPPVLLFIPSPNGSGISEVRDLVERLVGEHANPKPCGFTLAGSDRLFAARLARRMCLPSWGDASDVGHIAQKLIVHAQTFLHCNGMTNANAKCGKVKKRDAGARELVDEILGFLRDNKNLQAELTADTKGLRRRVSSEVRKYLGAASSERMMGVDVESLVSCVVDEVVGLGPIESFIKDPEISEIMANGSREIYIERGGVLERTKKAFRSDEHLLTIIERIVAKANRRIDESSPMVDARLADGSRVNAIIPPLAVDGPVLTIRRFIRRLRSMQDVVSTGMLGEESAMFLMDCIRSRVSVVVSGGTGSGKTTFLNVLASAIPSSERIITIEDSAELNLAVPHVVRLEAKMSNIEGAGAVTIRDLVRNALRMRPDRIVVGECRGAEALDMLQAMNTGHEGSLTTVHANSPRDAISRLETMVMMADIDLPFVAVREQIVRAVDLIVQLARMRDGKRRVVEISELTGMEGQVPCMQTLYRFENERGDLLSTGLKPRFLERAECDGRRLA